MSDVKETDYGISDEYLEQLADDCKINDLDLANEARSIVNRNQKYIEDFYRWGRKLKKLERKLKEVEGELYKYYKTDFEIKLTSYTDIMKFVQKDKKYQKIWQLRDDVEELVSFLERTIKNMSNNPWLVQKLIDLEKMNQ